MSSLWYLSSILFGLAAPGKSMVESRTLEESRDPEGEGTL